MTAYLVTLSDGRKFTAITPGTEDKLMHELTAIKGFDVDEISCLR